MKYPTILGLGTSFPTMSMSQEEMFEGVFKTHFADSAGASNAAKIFYSTRVRRRHVSWDLHTAFAGGSPLARDRYVIAERMFLQLARETIAPLLAHVNRADITSIVVASSTGYTGPGPDIMLPKHFELSRTIRRTFVGHMGCYAALPAIKVALDGHAARENEVTLVNCTEMASLHFVPHDTKTEQLISHALFGDGSATLLLANREEGEGTQILGTYTETLYECSDMMTLRMTDHGVQMTLSPYVPFALGECIERIIAKLLAAHGLETADVKHWGIHPGGPKIIDVVAKNLKLTAAQSRASHHVLAETGNCASAAILLVLKEIIDVDRPAAGDYGVFMAFGPGLTVDTMVVRFGSME